MPHSPQPFHVLAWRTWAPPIQVIEKVESYWMDKAQKMLDDLNALISKPSVLASPEPSETLLLYVSATTQVVSSALVVEQEESEHVYKVQRLVYCISKVLSDCETQYNQVLKLLYAVLITKWKLLHYFESHRVVISFSLGEIIGNHLATGRIAKWALKLIGLDLTYVSQMTIKSQAMENSVAEWTETQQPPPPHHSRALEHVFRWLFHPQWCRGRHSADLSYGRSTPLHYSTTLPHHQQRGRIRGVGQRSAHHCQAWGLTALYPRRP
jgi:hypothetical protein